MGNAQMLLLRNTWTHRFAICDVVCAVSMGVLTAASVPNVRIAALPILVALPPFLIATVCRRAHWYHSYALAHGIWHFVSAWAIVKIFEDAAASEGVHRLPSATHGLLLVDHR